MTDVTEIPIWQKCPWRSRLPAWVTVRRGWAFSREVIILEGEGLFVEYSAGHPVEQTLEPAFRNLACAKFERDHPGVQSQLPYMMAQYIAQGRKIPKRLTRQWNEYKELTSLLPVV